MKIMYLSSLYSPYIGGGAEITLQTLAESMASRGHKVHVVTLGPVSSGIKITKLNGVVIHRVGIENIYFHYKQSSASKSDKLIWHTKDIYNFDIIKELEQIIIQIMPAIISCHNITGWSISSWDVIKSLNIPIVQTLHDQYLLCINSQMYKNSKLCKSKCLTCSGARALHVVKSKNIDAVVGVSGFITKKHLSYGLFSKAKVIKSIHNARNFDFEPNLFQKEDTVFTVGFIGTLAKNKGIELLLTEFLSASEGKNWKLIMAGVGNEDYVKHLKVTYVHSSISFLGHVKQKEFFPKIDVLVVPSVWEEPLGMVVAESFMFGVPVIGSCLGGIKEMILEGITGCLFNPEVGGELYSQLSRFETNLRVWKGKRDKIISLSRVYSDSEAWALKWERLYEEVISKIGSKGRVNDCK